mgnify:CR=1 FL=1
MCSSASTAVEAISRIQFPNNETTAVGIASRAKVPCLTFVAEAQLTFRFARNTGDGAGGRCLSRAAVNGIFR